MATAMPVGITPAAAFRSLNRSSANTVNITLVLCTRRINLRARQLLCPRERLITRFSAAPPLLTSQSRSPHAFCARTSPKTQQDDRPIGTATLAYAPPTPKATEQKSKSKARSSQTHGPFRLLSAATQSKCNPFSASRLFDLSRFYCLWL